jgi:hypothetical protein
MIAQDFLNNMYCFCLFITLMKWKRYNKGVNASYFENVLSFFSWILCICMSWYHFAAALHIGRRMWLCPRNHNAIMPILPCPVIANDVPNPWIHHVHTRHPAPGWTCQWSWQQTCSSILGSCSVMFGLAFYNYDPMSVITGQTCPLYLLGIYAVITLLCQHAECVTRGWVWW